MMFCWIMLILLIIAMVCFHNFRNIESMQNQKKWLCLKKGRVHAANHETTSDYLLQFTIFPMSKKGKNIMQNTIGGEADDEEGAHSPTIGFTPGTTQLVIQQGANNKWDKKYRVPFDLPIKKEANVTISAIKNKLTIEVAGDFTVDSYKPHLESSYSKTYTVQPTRPAGKSIFYISNPWDEVADAVIKGVKYIQNGEGTAVPWFSNSQRSTLGSYNKTGWSDLVHEIGPYSACQDDAPPDYGWDQGTCQRVCKGKRFFALHDNKSHGSKCYCGDESNTPVPENKVNQKICKNGMGGENCMSVYRIEGFSSGKPSCPSRCFSCGKGTGRGGVDVGPQKETCSEYCSVSGYCGTSNKYKKLGTNCQNCKGNDCTHRFEPCAYSDECCDGLLCREDDKRCLTVNDYEEAQKEKKAKEGLENMGNVLYKGLNNVALAGVASQSSTKTSTVYIDGAYEYGDGKRYETNGHLDLISDANKCKQECDNQPECTDLTNCESKVMGKKCNCFFLTGNAKDAINKKNGKLDKFHTHTAEEANPWWSIDLKEEKLIKKIIIYNHDCCGEEKYKSFNNTGRLFFFNIWIGDREIPPSKHAQMKTDNTGVVFNEYGYKLVPEDKYSRTPTAGERIPIDLTSENFRGRYIYISRPRHPKREKTFLHLKEVEVYAPINRSSKWSFGEGFRNLFGGFRENIENMEEVDKCKLENGQCVSTFTCSDAEQDGTGATCAELREIHAKECLQQDCANPCEGEFMFGDKCLENCQGEFVETKPPEGGGLTCEMVAKNLQKTNPPRFCEHGEGKCIIQSCVGEWGECNSNCERPWTEKKPKKGIGESCEMWKQNNPMDKCPPGEGECSINQCDDGGKWECSPQGFHVWKAGSISVPPECHDPPAVGAWEASKLSRRPNDDLCPKPKTPAQKMEEATEAAAVAAASNSAQATVNKFAADIAKEAPSCASVADRIANRTTQEITIDGINTVASTTGNDLGGQVLGSQEATSALSGDVNGDGIIGAGETKDIEQNEQSGVNITESVVAETFTNLYGESNFDTTFQPLQHNCNRMFLPGLNICI